MTPKHTLRNRGVAKAVSFEYTRRFNQHRFCIIPKELELRRRAVGSTTLRSAKVTLRKLSRGKLGAPCPSLCLSSLPWYLCIMCHHLFLQTICTHKTPCPSFCLGKQRGTQWRYSAGEEGQRGAQCAIPFAPGILLQRHFYIP